MRRSVYCTASFSVCSLRRTELPIIYADFRLDYKLATLPGILGVDKESGPRSGYCLALRSRVIVRLGKTRRGSDRKESKRSHSVVLHCDNLKVVSWQTMALLNDLVVILMRFVGGLGRANHSAASRIVGADRPTKDRCNDRHEGEQLIGVLSKIEDHLTTFVRFCHALRGAVGLATLRTT